MGARHRIHKMYRASPVEALVERLREARGSRDAIDDLRAQREACLAQLPVAVRRLEEIHVAMTRDLVEIERLSGQTLKARFYDLIGRREELLAAGRADLLAAEVAEVTARALVDALKAEAARLAVAIDEHPAAGRVERLSAELRDFLARSPEAYDLVPDDVRALIGYMMPNADAALPRIGPSPIPLFSAELKTRADEVREAVVAGKRAQAALAELTYALDWGPSGFSAENVNRFQQVIPTLLRAERSLDQFTTEALDVPILGPLVEGFGEGMFRELVNDAASGFRDSKALDRVLEVRAQLDAHLEKL